MGVKLWFGGSSGPKTVSVLPHWYKQDIIPNWPTVSFFPSLNLKESFLVTIGPAGLLIMHFFQIKNHCFISCIRRQNSQEKNQSYSLSKWHSHLNIWWPNEISLAYRNPYYFQMKMEERPQQREFRHTQNSSSRFCNSCPIMKQQLNLQNQNCSCSPLKLFPKVLSLICKTNRRHLGFMQTKTKAPQYKDPPRNLISC